MPPRTNRECVQNLGLGVRSVWLKRMFAVASPQLLYAAAGRIGDAPTLPLAAHHSLTRRRRECRDEIAPHPVITVGAADASGGTRPDVHCANLTALNYRLLRRT